MIATLFATASTQPHPPPPPLLLRTSPIKRSKDFPAGWNNLSRTPQLGWRSWNAFGNRITQEMMLAAADALVAKNRTVKGIYGNVSLCGIGYCDIGVDEGWEGCGAGVNGTQHEADGTPTIDSDFPDTKKMVDEIHAKGLKAGWYLNGCKCGERSEHTINYEGDVRSLAAFGFDDVKIDGCGAQRNMTLYAELMRETGKAFTIENCHWGRCTDSDDSSCPTLDWCPFNSYRTSGDINFFTAPFTAPRDPASFESENLSSSGGRRSQLRARPRRCRLRGEPDPIRVAIAGATPPTGPPTGQLERQLPLPRASASGRASTVR